MPKINKYPFYIYVVISLLVFLFSIFGYSISSGIVKYIFYLIYGSCFALFFLYDIKINDTKIKSIGGVAAVLVALVAEIGFVLFLNIFFLIYLVFRAKWRYKIIFTMSLVFISLCFCGTFFLDMVTSKDTWVSNVSASGNKTLLRSVYDIGGWGYKSNYYVVEDYGLLERKYVVAKRGGMNDDRENVFIDEDTLLIQEVTYDISRKNVVFLNDTETIYRNKRMSIFSFFYRT